MDWGAHRRAGRRFGGSTADGLPFVFELRGDPTRVEFVDFDWRTDDCTPPGFATSTARLTPAFALDDGAFGGTDAVTWFGPDGSTAFEYVVDGEISGRRASGSFSATYTRRGSDGSETSCRAPETDWTARSG
jgi:hypothetical protein